jgi:hypothetical protein
MSTVNEIEAALSALSADDLRRIEAAVHRAQRQQDTSLGAKANPRLRALDTLEARLALDDQKANDWIAKVRDARR